MKARYVHPLVLVSSNTVGSDFTLLTFRSGWGQLPAWEPGQYFLVDHEFQHGLERRSYTPIRKTPEEVCFLIGHADGVFSRYLATCEAGTIIRTAGATGKAKWFPDEPNPITIVAIESGISFALSLLKSPGFPPATLIWMGKTAKPETAELLNRIFLVNFARVVPTALQPDGFPELIRPENLYFLAGDGVGIEIMRNLLIQSDVPLRQIRYEIYYNHRFFNP